MIGEYYMAEKAIWQKPELTPSGVTHEVVEGSKTGIDLDIEFCALQVILSNFATYIRPSMRSGETLTIRDLSDVELVRLNSLIKDYVLARDTALELGIAGETSDTQNGFNRAIDYFYGSLDNEKSYGIYFKVGDMFEVGGVPYLMAGTVTRNGERVVEADPVLEEGLVYFTPAELANATFLN